jgi:hypothetical protein
MGRHSRNQQGYNAVTNPTGTNGGDGAGPIQDAYNNQALVDSWNIDAAYDKNKKAEGEEEQ